MQGCLRSREGKYYYRRRVPVDLFKKYFKGHEILKSLFITDDGSAKARRAAQEAAQVWDVRINKVFYDCRHEDNDHDFKVRMVAKYVYPEQAKPAQSIVDIVAPPPPPKKRLKELFDAHITRHKIAKVWRFGTEADAVYALWLACEILENPVVDEILPADIDRLIQILCILPKNITRSKLYKYLSVKEILNLIETAYDNQKPKPQSTTTVIKDLIWIKDAFTDAKLGHLFDSAVFPKRSKRGGKKRILFDVEEVQKLIDLIRWQPKYPERLWAPIVAICHGLRAGEICQLRSDEIFVEKGEPCITITFEDEPGGRHVKGENVRTLPLHPFLVELGLVKYAQVTKQAGHTQLFHQITPRKNGESFSHDFTNWASRGYVRKVTEDERKTFHSFRHNFITYLNKLPYVKEHFVSFLAGHRNVENINMTNTVYTDSEDFRMLKDILNELYISQLDWISVRNEITKIEDLVGYIDYDFVEIHTIEQPLEDNREQ